MSTKCPRSSTSLTSDWTERLPALESSSTSSFPAAVLGFALRLPPPHTHRLMCRKSLEETSEQMSRAFPPRSSFFSCCPWKLQLLWLPHLCLLNLARLLCSAWVPPHCSEIWKLPPAKVAEETTGLTLLFSVPWEPLSELPVAQCLQIVVSYVLVCFLVAYRRRANSIPATPSLAKVSPSTFAQAHMLHLSTRDRFL